MKKKRTTKYVYIQCINLMRQNRKSFCWLEKCRANKERRENVEIIYGNLPQMNFIIIMAVISSENRSRSSHSNTIIIGQSVSLLSSILFCDTLATFISIKCVLLLFSSGFSSKAATAMAMATTTVVAATAAVVSFNLNKNRFQWLCSGAFGWVKSECFRYGLRLSLTWCSHCVFNANGIIAHLHSCMWKQVGSWL